jgi:peptidoglycan hydrolase CwlO-like protein
MDDPSLKLRQIALDQEAIQKNLIALREEVNAVQGKIDELQRRHAKRRGLPPPQPSSS